MAKRREYSTIIFSVLLLPSDLLMTAACCTCHWNCTGLMMLDGIGVEDRGSGSSYATTSVMSPQPHVSLADMIDLDVT